MPVKKSAFYKFQKTDISRYAQTVRWLQPSKTIKIVFGAQEKPRNIFSRKPVMVGLKRPGELAWNDQER